MDVEAYLRRIGYHGSREPTADTLIGIHRAHLLAVPFDNLDVMAGRRVRYDLESVVDKIVRRGLGGWCLELNPLFTTLLRTLGFDVRQFAAGVGLRHGGFSGDIEHMVLRVRIGGRNWLADVGFGGMSFTEPIPLPAGEVEQNGCRYRVRSEGGYHVLYRKPANLEWTPVYRYTTIPRTFADFDGVSDFHETSRQSPFTQRLICSRATEDGRVLLVGNHLTTLRGGVEQNRTLPEDEYRALLDQVLTAPVLTVS